MSPDPKFQAALALHRFGLGPKPGSIAAIASDPRAALMAELDQPGAGLIIDATLMSASQAARAAFNFREERQAREIAQAMAEKERAGSMGAESATEAKPAVAAKPGTGGGAAKPGQAAQEPSVPQRIFRSEARARFAAANAATVGFVERLVWFWSNHFCVSSDFVPVLAGGYEREAIRPHVLGRFADMLVAAESHPAMLLYLDNARSVGPKSVAGLIVKVGLNENLAREALELHTLGVRTGYTQDDVISFAKVLTGWTVLPAATDPQHGVEFVFNPRQHEPGPQVVIGKTYEQSGAAQGRAVFADLARHPATAEHIGRKLARHFVADDPPESLARRLAQRFQDTDGDLKEIAKALIESPEMWEGPLRKLKRPNEWLHATRRATNEPGGDMVRALRARAIMGEPLWRPPAPQGFADTQGPWVDGLAQRLDIAERVAERNAASLDPQDLLETALGPLASAETRRAITRAESRQQAITLALMAPEFNRR